MKSTSDRLKRYSLKGSVVIQLLAVGGLLCLTGVSQNVSAQTLLFSDGFEAGNFSKYVEDHGVQIVSSPTHSGTKALAYCYDCFQANGGGNTFITFAPRKHVYISFYWYFPSGFDFTHTGGRHAFRTTGIYSDNSTVQLDTEINSDFYFPVFANCVAGQCTNETLFNSVPTNFAAAPNHWFHVEIDFQLNTTPGNSDGFLKIWIDGAQKLNAVNQHFTNADNFLNQLWITTNDNNCAGGAARCTSYMDDWEMWDSKPSGGAITPPLSPPSNLQVQ